MTVERIEIDTEEGRCPARLVRGGSRAVILYMDAFGLRPALDDMAERLSGMGCTVLVPDLFYRFGAYGPYDARTAFANDTTRDELRAMMGATTHAMTAADTASFLRALEEAGARGPVGVVGYCMGGARAIHALAAFPDRIKVAASFHGGNLASDAPDSPHRVAGSIRGRVYVGMAGVDRSFPPEQSAELARAFREAEVDHIVENYVGMAHGWCVPDHAVFSIDGAERHWSRLEMLFSETL